MTKKYFADGEIRKTIDEVKEVMDEKEKKLVLAIGDIEKEEKEEK